MVAKLTNPSAERRCKRSILQIKRVGFFDHEDAKANMIAQPPLLTVEEGKTTGNPCDYRFFRRKKPDHVSTINVYNITVI
ncbi:MAG: hypothetical protein AUG89_08990 [Acidobacteria bacterium 13_1_20CM_4_56_7]|nr:MAG: hypothetical protein AUG89_08990 [Acidobacteria bacterium 13_1_20CM_4_56_7]